MRSLTRMDVKNGVAVLNTKKNEYKAIPPNVSIHLPYSHQDLGMRGSAIARRYPQYSRASIFRHIKKRVGGNNAEKRKNNNGRPPLLSVRDKRHITSQHIC